MVDPPLVSSKYIPQKKFLSNAAGKSYISLICPHSIFGNLPDLLVPDIRLFGPRKLVGAKHNLVLVKWTEISLFDEFVEALIFKITEGKKNFSANSRLHCLRRLAGTITNNFCFSFRPFLREQKSFFNVLSRPTSSARITPFENGLRKAPYLPDESSNPPKHPPAQMRASPHCQKSDDGSIRESEVADVAYSELHWQILNHHLLS